MDKKNIAIKQVKPSQLVPFIDNPRFNEAAIEPLINSISHFGFINPIIARKSDNMIIAGHTRWKAALKLNKKLVPVIFVDLSENDSKLYNIADNKLGEVAQWDNEKLAALLKELDDVDVTGFGDEEINELMSEFQETKEEDFNADAEAEKIKKPVSKLGEIYQLGKHRIMCGDSTIEKDVELLMDGRKADMVFTDPPYSVNYEKKNKEILKSKGNTKINGDELNVKEISEKVWRPVFKNLYVYAKDDCSFYITMPQGGDQMMMMMMMMSENWIVKHELIWLKPSPVFSMGRLDYDYKHEPIMYGWKKKHNFYGKGEHIKPVWEIGRESDKSHPTMKPTKLIINALLNSSKPNSIILDLFLGSGSTLIASEQTNRICYGMEIEPLYIDVIINRFHKYNPDAEIKCLNAKKNISKIYVE